MIKNVNAALIVALLFLCNTNAFAELRLQEIRSASSNVLIAFFTSDTLDVSEVDIENISEWKINGQIPKNIYRYVTQANACDHHVYLETSRLEEGKNYQLETPHGNMDFQFGERNIFCESIKTNQVGYSALSKVRYANFAIWLGTGGSRKIEGPLPSYEVFEQFTGEVVARGSVIEIGADSSSGDYVYRMDLSDVPEGGPYRIALKGIGCSYPFGVGGDFSKKLAYTIFRAQYLQRCGCPIHKPDIRKDPCHTLIYDVDGPIGEANIDVVGDERTFQCYGGYHDAGDADRRAYHISK